MRRQNPAVPKVRKRGFSSSSSASSIVHSCRIKRAIIVGKGRHALGRSRSGTPAPAWRTPPLLRPAVESFTGTTRPVSARKLAATLWEMNDVPSPKVAPERRRRCSVPPYLSDPSHSPVSERMDRSGSGSYPKRMSSSSHRMRPGHTTRLDSLSTASLVEMRRETKPRVSASTISVIPDLKDVSTALTTSKELLRILNRIWAHAGPPPSSSTSLVSALHDELERARQQVNQMIEEKRSGQTEFNFLIKCFAEERAVWKKEKKDIESVMGPIVNELEVERKLRRRSESLNNKLEKELADAKASFMKAVKTLENERRTREIIEQTCSELVRENGDKEEEEEEEEEEKGGIENLKRKECKEELSPSRQWDPRDPRGSVSERSSVARGDASKSRLADFNGEGGHSMRRSKW